MPCRAAAVFEFEGNQTRVRRNWLRSSPLHFEMDQEERGRAFMIESRTDVV